MTRSLPEKKRLGSDITRSGIYGYSTDQVLDVQKQAYKDGLRDAQKACDIKASVRAAQGLPREFSAARALSEEIGAMLTSLETK